MYDITNRDSYNHLKHWLQECDRYACESVNKIIVGTKCDEESKRAVPYSEAKDFADGLGIDLFEISSATGTNVEESMLSITNNIRNRYLTNYMNEIIIMNF